MFVSIAKGVRTAAGAAGFAAAGFRTALAGAAGFPAATAALSFATGATIWLAVLFFFLFFAAGAASVSSISFLVS